ncbi:hypothetical protein [Stenotrophomonas rhizophila]|uniref:hypothetical protein n=1 Tax=Stenotrophomonas rhizophila TaxID=216778 RepID=UPI001642FEC1|nr:hypothetical protein [Stenotrophomonas rhizophila]
MPQAIARLLPRFVPRFVLRTAQLLRRPRDTAIPVKSHILPLTGISNHATRALTAPVQVTRMPSAAANADPADAARAPGPHPEALEILSGQVHALLDVARGTSPTFDKAVAAITPEPRQPLTAKQCTLLLRAIKSLPGRTPAALPKGETQEQREATQRVERQQLLRSALYDLTRATRAEAMLHEQIARHAERERGNALPGSERSSGTGGMLGVRVGLPGAVDAGAAGGVRHETSTGTFDDLTIGTVRSATVMAEASTQARVAPGVGIGGTVSGYASHADADISMSMRTRVLRLAHASVARRLGGNAVQRAFKRLSPTRRDRYDERTSRALAWQSSPALSLLLGERAAGRPLEFGKRPLLIRAGMSTHGGALAGTASYGVGQLGASGALSRTELRAALPTRLTELDSEGVAAGHDPEIRKVLDARVAHLVAGVDKKRSPALQTVQALLRQPRHPQALAKRLEAAAHVGVAFDHLQALADLSLRAPAQAQAPLASLARDWGSDSGAREPVLINMLDTLAWLQSAPEPDAGPAHAQWEQLQRTVQDQARRIQDTPLPHDRERVHHATHAFREQIQRIATTRGTLSLSAALPLFGAGAEVSVARHVRQDPDPLRDGTYLELTLSAHLGPALGTILDEVQRQLPEWGTLPLREAQALIDPLAASADVTGNVQCLVRFFRPSFQTDPEFPASARGNHLHAVRLATGGTRSLGVTVPLPVLPGVAPTFSLQHARSTQTTRYDRLGEGTLTSALMRYQALCSATTPHEETWAALLETHAADLDRLADALVDARSVPALEARYWLQREPASSTGAAPTRRAQPDTRTLDAFNLEGDRATRREQLYALFEAVGAITGKQKSTSPLIGPLVLPVIG